MRLIAISTLLCISLFGVKALLIFSSRNGLFGRLEKATKSIYTPSGRPLRLLTTNGRFPKVDKQIKAVCVFFLLYCEDWTVPETCLAGFSFVGAWGASWALIMLDSLRLYSQQRLLSWISIPGIFIFNYSHAIFTPLYLAYRLAFTPSPTPEGFSIDPAHLNSFKWAFLIGYCVPVMLISLPGVMIKGVNTKHTLSGWYQQWNLYISSCQYIFATLWRALNPERIQPTGEENLKTLEKIYSFVFAMASVAHWVPLLICFAEMLRPAIFSQKSSLFLQPWKALVPASPFSNKKAESASEGGRWLIQWDIVTGTMATIVWAGSLYLETYKALSFPVPYKEMAFRTLWWGALGGPMSIPVALLWSRDKLIYEHANLFHK